MRTDSAVRSRFGGGLLQLVVAGLELRLGQGELPAPLGDADLQLVVGPPQGLLGALDPLADPPGDPRAEHGAHQEGDDRPDRRDQRREPPPGGGGDPVGRPRGRRDGADDERQELAHQSGADRRPAQRAEQEAARPGGGDQPDAEQDEAEGRVQRHRDRPAAVEEGDVVEVAEDEDPAQARQGQGQQRRGVGGGLPPSRPGRPGPA